MPELEKLAALYYKYARIFRDTPQTSQTMRTFIQGRLTGIADAMTCFGSNDEAMSALRAHPDHDELSDYLMTIGERG